MTDARIGITLGDPAGIGPEIVAARARGAAGGGAAASSSTAIAGRSSAAARACGVALPDVPVVGDGTGERAEPGKPDDACGAAQVGYLEAAVAAARAGELAALVDRADLEDVGAARRVRVPRPHRDAGGAARRAATSR